MIDFKTLALRRRSIREYESTPVPMAVISELLAEAALAPSSYNGQPWHVAIVSRPDLLLRISEDCRLRLLDELAAHPDSRLRRDADDLARPDYHIFYQAPVVIFIAGPADLDSLDVDIALFASHFMLAAAARRLGTCWVGLGTRLTDPDLKNQLGLSDNFRLVAPICLGYPRSAPPAPERRPVSLLKIIA